jgi:hypothetical protein
MRCFYHPTHEAAGVCRNCGRGICSDCIAISEEAVACRGKCEERVAAIQRTVQGNQAHFRAAAGQLRQGGIYAIFMGILFAAMGAIFVQLIGADFGRYMGILFIAFGALIIVRGVSSTWAARRYAQQTVNSPSQPKTSEMDRFR